jgi:hypothetical protein
VSAAPEMKYTDRDVREDPMLMELAIAYLIDYTGEFEPLVEAKELFQEYGRLTTPIIRKVLNCMRHDAQVAMKLPEPKYSNNVVDFTAYEQRQSDTKRRKIKYGDKQCPTQVSHEWHTWGEFGENRCKGVPYSINRLTVYTSPRVKVKYATTRTGKLIHDVDPNGGHQLAWHSPRHQWGFRSTERPYYTTDADLSVKVRCRFPSYIRTPILIPEEMLEQYKTIEDPLMGLRELIMCPHCAKVRLGE